jgi:hypothetical protein
LPTRSREAFSISTTFMLGTPAVFYLSVGIEFAVHARQHLAIDIWLRITFGVVFASSLVLGSRTCLQDSAASFYARMSLAGDGRRQVVGGPSKFLQLIQTPNNSSDLKFENSRSHARAYRDKGCLAADWTRRAIDLETYPARRGLFAVATALKRNDAPSQGRVLSGVCRRIKGAHYSFPHQRISAIRI